MRPVSYLPQMLTVFVVSAAAAAQSPWGFPIGQRFVAASLNGQAYQDKAPTITVRHDAQRGLAGSGFAGCNTWFGKVTLGQTQFGVGELGTTRMFCADQMQTETAFLEALKSAKRWRMDGSALVLEGDQVTLRLIPAR
ncbi:MAG TPA: META domain-containing protein [Xanthobacteraceae bacterium]|nr:META domain-containing protein [Xanthobacteraceae bacterium]